jgi:hypothetical protein
MPIGKRKRRRRR